MITGGETTHEGATATAPSGVLTTAPGAGEAEVAEGVVH